MAIVGFLFLRCFVSPLREQGLPSPPAALGQVRGCDLPHIPAVSLPGFLLTLAFTHKFSYEEGGREPELTEEGLGAGFGRGRAAFSLLL